MSTMTTPEVARTATSPPLEGLVVLEAATVIAGPMTSMILADYGARVIKVEHPTGDSLRAQSNGLSKFFGRNKECITCNLSTREGAELFRKLAAQADVVIENFRPGTFARWGLSYESLAADNPGLVMLHLSGFGQDGPWVDRPGYGSLVEALSGLTAATGHLDGPPTPPGQPVADPLAAMSSVSAILMALHERNRTGLGQEIDISLYGPMLYLMGMSLSNYSATGQSPIRGGYFSSTNIRALGECSDGSWVLVVAIDAKRLRLITEFLGARGQLEKPADEITAADVGHALRTWLATVSRDRAIAELTEADIPNAPVNSVPEAVQDPLFEARGDFIDYQDGEGSLPMPRPQFRFSRSSVRTDYAGPAIGSHNASVYGDWLGMNDEALQDLTERGVI